MTLSFHWNKKVGIVTKFYFLKFCNNFKNHINFGNSQLNYAYSINNLLKHQIEYDLKYQSYIYIYTTQNHVSKVFMTKTFKDNNQCYFPKTSLILSKSPLLDPIHQGFSNNTKDYTLIPLYIYILKYEFKVYIQ
jgi:hypothetical protein